MGTIIARQAARVIAIEAFSLRRFAKGRIAWAAREGLIKTKPPTPDVGVGGCATSGSREIAPGSLAVFANR